MCVLGWIKSSPGRSHNVIQPRKQLRDFTDHRAVITQRQREFEAYGRVIPTWNVSPPLAELNRDRFHRPVKIVPPALEPYWRPRRRLTLPRIEENPVPAAKVGTIFRLD